MLGWMGRKSDKGIESPPPGVCELHAHPGAQICHDCGIAAWRIDEGGRFAHEDFYVDDALWDSICPDDEAVEWTEDGVDYRVGTFVLCIGCFEDRLRRQLTKEDFQGPPQRMFGMPPSYRFRRRWKATRDFGAGERT